MKKRDLVFILYVIISFSTEAQNRLFIQKEAKSRNEFKSEKERHSFETHFFNGIRQKALGNIEAAIDEFQKCIYIDGTKAAPMHELALLYHNLSQYEEALFFAEGATAIQEKNIWYQQLKSQLYISNQKYTEAIHSYKQLLKVQPNNEEWQFQLASTYLLNNQPNKAIDIYNKIEDYVGVNEMLSLQKHRIYLQINDKKGAQEELEKWLYNDPENLQPYSLLAEHFLLEGNQEEAIKILEKSLKVDTNNGKALLTLTDLYRANGRVKESSEVLKKAFFSKQLGVDSKMRFLIEYYDASIIDSTLTKEAFKLIDILTKVHPEDAKPHTIAGDFYYREGRLIDAKKAFVKALSFDKSRFPIWQQLLIVCFELKEYDEVVNYGNQVMELYPSETTVYLLKGMAQFQLKKFELAISTFNTGVLMVVENNDLLAQFYSNLGDSYHALKNNSLSDISYEKSLSFSPKNSYVLNNYSYYLSLRKEKLDKALEMMKLCTTISPRVPSYEDTYAWVFYQSGNYEEAEKWLQKALQNGGNENPVIVEHYGDVLFRLNRKKEAVDAWKKAKAMGAISNYIDKKIAEKKLYE